MMFSTHTKIPRSVGPFQAAAILYGDWGTSKAYVIGLAFALAGHASFWLILLVGVLNLCVGLNYIAICKYYPSGGGVYASVRHRSKVLALLGAFFLIADYIVTAALSALSAFYYFGVPSPQIWAMAAIVIIGLINFFGPRYSSRLALTIAILSCTVVLSLGALTIPYLEQAIDALQPLQGGVKTNWIHFVSVIVALSGIESIANITGVMRLDKGSTQQNPSVAQTARKAILWVTAEVIIMTSLFSLAANALPELTVFENTVNAPGEPDVRDYMLRYMAQIFSTDLFGTTTGMVAGFITSSAIGILLLSAVNTATVTLEALLFNVASDREIPLLFKKLNRFGVPHYALLTAIVCPVGLLLLEGDIPGLADLYAVGFVGAIATNLGVTSLNRTIDLKIYERAFMFVTFLVMISIEITLLIEKPNAAHFAVSILAIGLFLRGLVVESYEKETQSKKEFLKRHNVNEAALIKNEEQSGVTITGRMLSSTHSNTEDIFDSEMTHIHQGSLMCAITHVGKTLEFALEEAKNEKQLLYILFVREQRLIAPADKEKDWWEDADACKIVDSLLYLCQENPVKFLYQISDSPVDSIVEMTHSSRVSRLILGLSRKNKLVQLIQGNFISRVSKKLSPDVDLIIIS